MHWSFWIWAIITTLTQVIIIKYLDTIENYYLKTKNSINSTERFIQKIYHLGLEQHELEKNNFVGSAEPAAEQKGKYYGSKN
jgi:hypothetical protein